MADFATYCPHCFTGDPGEDYCASCGEPLRDQTIRRQRAGVEPCPMGCGGLTEDVYGGPCKECWKVAPR